jgi:hypothetical protein
VPVFDPRDAVTRAAEATRRLAQDRAAEVARGAALAQGLPAALAATDAGAVSRLSQLLVEFGSLTPAGREAFAAAATATEAAGQLRQRLQNFYPAGSVAREVLGTVVGRRQGRAVTGGEAQALASKLIAQATGSDAPRKASSLPERDRDAVEPARPRSLFERAHGGQAPSSVASAPPVLTRPPAAERAPLVPGSQAAPDLQSRAVSSAPVPPSAVAPESRRTPLLRQAASFARIPDSLEVATPGLQSAAARFSSVRASLVRARGALAAQARESPRVQYGLRAAARGLEAIDAHAVAAEDRLVREVAPAPSPKSVLAGVAAAQGELRAVLPPAAEAREALVDVARGARYADVRAAVREIDAVARESARAEADLGLVEGRLTVLDAARPPVSTASAPSAGQPSSSTGGLTEEDLQRLGSGLAPGQPPPQIAWTEAAVDTACERGRAQGGVSDADGQAHFELAGRLLGGAAAPVALGAADLAAAAKEAGIPLEKVDPQQLDAAARYVSAATSGGEQQDRLRKALDGFQTLASIGAPRLTRQEMVDQLWAAAKVPGHALQKLKDAEVAKTLQQVASAVNGGPGEHQLKVGSYNLKFTVGTSGDLVSSSCKKPGFFSRIGSALEKVVPVALTVASFIPATAAFARIAQGAISLAKSVRAKSLLGGLTSAASLVAGGVAAFAGEAVGVAGTAANKVAAIASGAARGLQGVSSLKQGSVLGGLAAIGSGVAGGIGSFAKTVGDGLSGVAKRLGDFSTRLAQGGQAVSVVESYRSAGWAVSEAKTALRQAEASGDRAAIAAAQEQLARAESAKTGAVLGSVAQAASLAADVRAAYARQPGEAVNTPGARVTLDVALRTAWRGLNVARGIHDRDYAAAGASALGLAAVTRQAAGAEPSDELGLTDAANMADAALGYHQASQGEDAANAAVADAERALRAARLGGDAAAIRQAEANLAEARKSREGALMGGIAAGETLLATAEAIGRKLRASRAAALTGTPPADDKVREQVDRAVRAGRGRDGQPRAPRRSPRGDRSPGAGRGGLQPGARAGERQSGAPEGGDRRLRRPAAGDRRCGRPGDDEPGAHDRARQHRPRSDQAARESGESHRPRGIDGVGALAAHGRRGRAHPRVQRPDGPVDRPEPAAGRAGDPRAPRGGRRDVPPAYGGGGPADGGRGDAREAARLDTAADAPHGRGAIPPGRRPEPSRPRPDAAGSRHGAQRPRAHRRGRKELELQPRFAEHVGGHEGG